MLYGLCQYKRPQKGYIVSTKNKRSFRLTPTADALLELLADKKGLSKTAVLETLIRDEAKRNKVTIPALPTPESEPPHVQ